MMSKLLALILLLGYFPATSQQVELKSEITEDIKRRFPEAEIQKYNLRGGAYSINFFMENGVTGVISYSHDNDAFQQYQLMYEELPNQLFQVVSKLVNLSDILKVRFVKRNDRPGYYTIRTKTGGLVFDKNYQYLENGVVLNGLESVPQEILSHLNESYKNLVIKETGIKKNKYFSRIEFESDASFAQAAIVKYTMDFQWIDTSFYFWDLSTLPIEIFLAMDKYGGIEAVREARQFFQPNGNSYFLVEIKNQKKVYFDQNYQLMVAQEN